MIRMHNELGCEHGGCTGEHVTLVGGPLDGHLLPVDGWPPQDRAIGVAHIVDGWEDRACYAPLEGDPGAEWWEYEGVLP